MRKLAKIESPSPNEKKHISEEEMYIDQPVADDIENNKILYKRSMKKMSYYDNVYENMVKEAYENILDGFDKEAYAKLSPEELAAHAAAVKAANSGSNYYGNGSKLTNAQKKKVGALHESAIAKHYTKDNSRLKKKYDVAPGGPSPAEVLKSVTEKNREQAKKDRMWRLLELKRAGKDVWDNMPTWGKATTIAAPLTLAAAGGTLAALKHRKKNEEDAEKAAAIYEEAQLVKEAAEADFEMACAYEDAALQILDELGLFED